VDIQTAAALATFDSGPVVFLNFSKHRCDAIILGCSPGEITYTCLGDLADRVNQWRRELKKLTWARNERLHGGRQRKAEMDADTKFAHLLGQLWVSIVRPVLGVIQDKFSVKVGI
jgi:hypothetical protein